MKVTVNKVDGVVGKDGVSYPVDCSHLPEYVRIIQWDSVAKSGEIEFHRDSGGRFVPNMKIVDFTPYQYLLESWDQAKVAADRAAEELEAKIEAAKAAEAAELAKARAGAK